MLECLIIGDSIAVGIGQARPECVLLAQIGINSERWSRRFRNDTRYNNTAYKVLVISLSTNDYRSMTTDALYAVRRTADAAMVIWILPNRILKPLQYQIVSDIAKEFGDSVLDISKQVGPDQIHPNAIGYKEIAKKTMM